MMFEAEPVTSTLRRLGAAETAACVAQCIPQHDDVNNATNEPEGESIYRNVCQLEEELEGAHVNCALCACTCGRCDITLLGMHSGSERLQQR